MKFRKFKQEKLWRDNAVARLEKDGSRIHLKKLNDEEFAHALKDKLREEAAEVVAASDRVEVLAELADVLEVVRSLAAVHGYRFEDVIAAADAKLIERGGFEGRNYVIFAEHPVGSFGEAYCLANPAVYPEIFE